MCRHSLEGYAHFRAEDGDKFVVAGPAGSHARGFYSDKPATAGSRSLVPGKAMACVITGQKLTLSNFRLEEGAPAYQWNASRANYERASLTEYAGKEVVVEVFCIEDPFTHSRRPESADAIRFVGGEACFFHHIAAGVEGFVGTKPSLDERLGLVTMAQVAGDNAADPDPKPADKPDDQKDPPADAPEPVKEPASFASRVLSALSR